MPDQKTIVNLIIRLEKKYAVDEWSIEGIKIWPYLRLRLFLFLLKSGQHLQKADKITENVRHTAGSSRFHFLLKVISFYKWRLKLKKKKYIFVGNDFHRVDHKSKRYNRFFDTYIEKEKISSNYYFFELDDLPVEKKNNSNRILKYRHFLPVYTRLYFFRKRKKKKTSLKGFNEFISELNNDKYTCQFANASVPSKAHFVDHFYKAYVVRYSFYLSLLQQIKPQQVFILCYYSLDGIAITAAAKHVGSITIDYQHGPQNEYHLAYGNWTKIPSGGFEMLPSKFWTWDCKSAEVINSWCGAQEYHSAVVKGNYWVEYWKGENKKQISEKKFILYSLQHYPLEVHFTAPVIDAIENMNFIWYLRLHPAFQSSHQEIIGFFKKLGLENKIELEKATSSPLPSLLLNCAIHVTNSSGCGIEANLLNKKTVILDEYGQNYYAEEIAAKDMVYIDKYDHHFRSKLLKQIK